MWGFSQEQSSVSDSGTEDYRYQDLCQENAILKQELADLYSHLMIIDDSSETNGENSKVSSVGRLIVYDKTKRDTEILLANESNRQKICVLEKELSFQHSHLKEQAIKMKELESKLAEAKQNALRLEVDLVSSSTLRAKVKELATILDNHATNDFLINKQLAELTQSQTEALAKVDLLTHDLKVVSDAKLACEERLSISDGLLKATQNECVQLKEELTAANELQQETQIQRKKEEVRLLVSQTEAKHLERKCDSQAKELLRLREVAGKLQSASHAPSYREDVDGLSVSVQKKMTFRTDTSRPCESEDDDVTPLIPSEESGGRAHRDSRGEGRAVSRRAGSVLRQQNTPSSNSSGDRDFDRERERDRSRIRMESSDSERRHRQQNQHQHQHQQQQQRYNEVSYSGYDVGGTGRGASRDGGSSRQYRPVQRSDERETSHSHQAATADGQQQQGEDCMCGFFPQPFIVERLNFGK